MYLDDWTWLAKFTKARRNDVPRGKTPRDGVLFHELDWRYRRFPGPAVDELARKIEAKMKPKDPPDE